MRVTVTLSTEAFQRSIDRLREAVSSAALEQAAMRGAEVIADEVRLAFRDTDDLSIPGLAPRIDSGDYLQSIQVVPDEQEFDSASVVVGTDLVDPPYPRFLEFGTSKMPAHPIIRPSYETAKEDAATATIQDLVTRIHEAVTP